MMFWPIFIDFLEFYFGVRISLRSVIINRLCTNVQHVIQDDELDGHGVWSIGQFKETIKKVQ